MRIHHHQVLKNCPNYPFFPRMISCFKYKWSLWKFENKNLISPNSIIHHQTSQKLSPKHAARGVAQSPYPIYRHGKACLSKQPPWRAAGDPRLARGRSRVRAPGPAGALRALFFSTLPSFLLREIVFFRTFPTKPTKVLGLCLTTGWVYY